MIGSYMHVYLHVIGVNSPHHGHTYPDKNKLVQQRIHEVQPSPYHLVQVIFYSCYQW